MKILLGTQNKGKQEEVSGILLSLAKRDNIDLKVVFPQDIGITTDVKETGRTFEENSFKKAKFYFNKSKISTISDDGGLEIKKLGGEPGVKTRRWPGYKASDEELIKYTLKKLKEYQSKKDRKAQLRACIAFYDGKYKVQDCEKIKGYISKKPSEKRIKGYPFRSLFIVDKIGKYYDELNEREHEKVNHRKKLLERMWDKIS